MTVEAIAPLGPADWEDVAHIYAEGIATGEATFETGVPDWELPMERRSPVVT